MKPRLLLLVLAVIAFCLGGCKKDAKAPAASIYAKWLIKKHNAVFFRNNAQIGTIVTTSYTPNDFAQYFSDGSGLLSANTTGGTGVSRFTFTLKGTTLTQYDNGDTHGVTETITDLTGSTMTIHYSLIVPNPDDTSAVYTEVHDYYFTKAN